MMVVLLFVRQHLVLRDTDEMRLSAVIVDDVETDVRSHSTALYVITDRSVLHNHCDRLMRLSAVTKTGKSDLAGLLYRSSIMITKAPMPNKQFGKNKIMQMNRTRKIYPVC